MIRKPFLIGLLLALMTASGMVSVALAQTATPSPVSPTATEVPVSPTPDTDVQAAALAEQGNAHLDRGQYAEAVEAYTQALSLNPDDGLLYHYRGFTYGRMEQYERAIADYSKAIELLPDYTYAYGNRGFAYNQLGQIDKAIADYDKAIALNPNYAA
ncbi:MAG: tetratricopeptide repeat protein, partial [Anaerolineae bacterium]|nr:tetratricopeptide repeat protein [Anaerolineae bacterium]